MIRRRYKNRILTIMPHIVTWGDGQAPTLAEACQLIDASLVESTEIHDVHGETVIITRYRTIGRGPQQQMSHKPTQHKAPVQGSWGKHGYR